MGRTRFKTSLVEARGFGICDSDGNLVANVVNGSGEVIGDIVGDVKGNITEEAVISEVPIWESMVGSGLGAGGSYAKTTDGTVTLHAADNTGVRDVLWIIKVTEDFADAGEDDQPVFMFGEADDTDAYDDGSLLVDASEGDMFVLTGENTQNKAVVITATQATGASTGAINVMCFVRVQPE